MNLKWNQFMMLEVPWFYNIKQRDIKARIVRLVRLFVIDFDIMQGIISSMKKSQQHATQVQV